jgi:hypothetical protein
MEKFFFVFTVKNIPRDQNNEADMLAKVAAQKNDYYQMSSAKFSSANQ